MEANTKRQGLLTGLSVSIVEKNTKWDGQETTIKSFARSININMESKINMTNLREICHQCGRLLNKKGECSGCNFVPFLCSCGRLMQQKEKKIDEMKQFYNDYPFPNDSIESLNELEVHSWVLKSIPDYISLGDKDVCDIGCGTGEIGMYISRKVKSYKGFDFSHNSIHLAKIKSKRLGLKNTSFEVLDITKEHKGKYDIVFCIGVLHHIKEKDKAIENIKEMLKPNGILVISVYNKYSCMIGNSNPNEMNKSRYMDTYKNPYETFYTQGKFKRELYRWGFEILGFYRYIPELVRLFTGRGRMMTFTARLR